MTFRLTVCAHLLPCGQKHQRSLIILLEPRSRRSEASSLSGSERRQRATLMVCLKFVWGTSSQSSTLTAEPAFGLNPAVRLWKKNPARETFGWGEWLPWFPAAGLYAFISHQKGDNARLCTQILTQTGVTEETRLLGYVEHVTFVCLADVVVEGWRPSWLASLLFHCQTSYQTVNNGSLGKYNTHTNTHTVYWWAIAAFRFVNICLDFLSSSRLCG